MAAFSDAALSRLLMAAPFLEPCKDGPFIEQDLPAQADHAPVEPVLLTVEEKVSDSARLGPFVLTAEL